MGEVGRGIVLSFSRFERIRDDKRPDLAATSQQLSKVTMRMMETMVYI